MFQKFVWYIGIWAELALHTILTADSDGLLNNQWGTCHLRRQRQCRPMKWEITVTGTPAYDRPPPLEIALWQMDRSQSQGVCAIYACIWINWGKDTSTCITCGVSWGGEHRGSLSALRPRESWCRWRRRRCAALELQRPRGCALHTHIVLTIVSVHDGNDAIFRDTLYLLFLQLQQLPSACFPRKVTWWLRNANASHVT